MADDFNELLDQTETRAQALSVEADKTIELLDSVDEMVDNLSSTIEASANEAKESFDTLTEQISTAEDTLQTHQETAKESMNGLMQQMQDAGGRIQERLSQALTQFSELQAKQEEFFSEVNNESEDVGENFGKLGQQCNQTSDDLVVKFENLEETIKTLIDNLSSTLEENAETQNKFIESLSKLLTSINSLDDISESSELLVKEIDTSVNQFQSILIGIFNKSVTPEMDNFISSTETIGDLGEKTSQNLRDFSIESEHNEENLNQGLALRLNKGIETMEYLNSIASIIEQINQDLN